ncbi:unnamed protein product [Cylindrotheca closterium]|uniref:Uncharacterized protein n=1 Tax=Cylindrotheca closterium TaxID=2856 RepID=A0AAD2CD07_9STRA|nr:unnamed protein product [Cylindrotheca closterium]
MGKTSLPTSRDSIHSASSQETTGEDSCRQRSIDGSMAVESKPQTGVSRTETNQDIKTANTESSSVSAAADPARNHQHGKASESSLDSIVNEANQGHEQLLTPTVVVDMPSEKPRTNQTLSEQRSVTPSDFSNAGSATLTNSASPNPQTIVQQHLEKPPPAPKIQQNQNPPQSTVGQPEGLRPSPTAPAKSAPQHHGKPFSQQATQPDAQQPKERSGSRFTITPVTSAPQGPAQTPPIQHPQSRRPSLATSTASTQHSVQSAQQQYADASQSQSVPSTVTQTGQEQHQQQHQQQQQQHHQQHHQQQQHQQQQQYQQHQQPQQHHHQQHQQQQQQHHHQQHAQGNTIGSQHSNFSQLSQSQTSQDQQSQQEPVETLAPLPSTPASVPTRIQQPQAMKHRSISVPCAPQPYPGEVGRSQSGPDSQTTYYYQIPGVIPVQTIQKTSTRGGGQPQEQIIGTVGAIPLMKVQDGLRYVKKGRFKLFQQTAPAPAPAQAVVPGPPESVPAVVVTQPLVPPAPIVAATEEIVSPKLAQASSGAAPVATPSPAAQSQEPKAAGEQNATGANGNSTPLPETLDGSSVPTVTKKGRFLVSKVNNVRTMIPAQNVAVPGAPVEAVPPPQSLHLPTMMQPAVNQPQTQSVIAPVQHVAPPVVQTTMVQQVQQVQQTHFEAVPGSHQVQQVQQTHFEAVPGSAVPVGSNWTASPFFSLQSTAVITEPYAASPHPSQQQQNQQVQSHRMTPVPQGIPEANATTSQTHVTSNTQTSTPPQTPNMQLAASTSLTQESTRRSMQAKALPEIPKGTEKARMAPTVPKKKALARAGPHALDRGGKLSLGKLSYLLDQMKSEVTDADLLIRTLQTDLKLMRDKNKALEAKNRDLDKSLKEEKGLREKAEARNIELRKKMREANIMPGTNGQKPLDQTVDSSATSASAKTKADGVAITKAKAPKAAVAATGPKAPTASEAIASSNPKRDPTAAPPAAIAEKKCQPQPPVGENKVDRPATNGVSIPATQNPASSTISLGREQGKEQFKRAVANGWHARSNSLGNAGDAFLQQVTADFGNTSPAKPKGGAQHLSRMESVGAVNGAAPTPIPAAAKPVARGALKPPCVKAFDPLHQNQPATNITGDMVPVMIPTQVSLVNADSPVFQDPHDPAAYQQRTTGLQQQYEQNQFVQENNIVVPITFGMASTMDQANMENGMQHQDINQDLRNLQQQFMVLPQQQPIMVHQVPGGVQQVQNLIAGQMPQTFTSNGNTFPSYGQPMMQQQSEQQQPQLFYSIDSFDPLK